MIKIKKYPIYNIPISYGVEVIKLANSVLKLFKNILKIASDDEDKTKIENDIKILEKMLKHT